MSRSGNLRCCYSRYLKHKTKTGQCNIEKKCSKNQYILYSFAISSPVRFSRQTVYLRPFLGGGAPFLQLAPTLWLLSVAFFPNTLAVARSVRAAAVGELLRVSCV